MFYAHFVLSKKGPLARIWLAAHWDKKLTKAHVFETNIDSSVEAIIEPKVKLALRTSGHLLLGVVRIYSRKAKYLLADCNEAFVKIKMAFRPGVVDMPEENREAAVATITLPETFHDFETTMADLSDIDVQAQFSVNQSRPEEITMREDLGNITLVGDDGFGDMGFDDRNMIQDANMDETLYKNPDSAAILLDDSLEKHQDDVEKPMDIDFDAPNNNDDFGKEFDDFDEGPAGVDDDNDSDHDGGFGDGVDDALFRDDFIGEAGGLFEEPPAPEPQLNDTTVPKDAVMSSAAEKPPTPAPVAEELDEPVPDQTTVRDQTTLVHNEAEAFALEPLDVTNLGTERKAKRKRKLVVDEQKGITSETMKMQLADTSEIMTTLDLAPPTKKLMHWKETGGVEKLFALPGRPLPSKKIRKFFTNNLITKPMLDTDDDDDRLELEGETVQEEDQEVVREETPAPVYEPAPLEPPHLEPPPMLDDQPPRAPLDQSTFSARDSLLPNAPPDVSLPAPDVSLPAPDVSLLQPEVSLPPPPRDDDDDSAHDEGDDKMAAAPSSPQPPAAATTTTTTATTTTTTTTTTNDNDDTDDDNNDADDNLVDANHDNEEENEADFADVFNMELPEEEEVPKEQVDDTEEEENEEEREERRWGKRTQQMLHILTKSLTKSDTASFNDMCKRNYRKQVASKFYTLLVLKKQQAIVVDQPTPYADIIITKGPKFELVY